MIWFLVWIASMSFTVYAAGQKNRDRASWFVLSFLFGPLALLAIAAVPSLPLPPPRPILSNEEQKTISRRRVIFLTTVSGIAIAIFLIVKLNDWYSEYRSNAESQKMEMAEVNSASEYRMAMNEKSMDQRNEAVKTVQSSIEDLVIYKIECEQSNLRIHGRKWILMNNAERQELADAVALYCLTTSGRLPDSVVVRDIESASYQSNMLVEKKIAVYKYGYLIAR